MYLNNEDREETSIVLSSRSSMSPFKARHVVLKDTRVSSRRGSYEWSHLLVSIGNFRNAFGKLISTAVYNSVLSAYGSVTASFVHSSFVIAFRPFFFFFKGNKRKSTIDPFKIAVSTRRSKQKAARHIDVVRSDDRRANRLCFLIATRTATLEQIDSRLHIYEFLGILPTRMALSYF